MTPKLWDSQNLSNALIFNFQKNKGPHRRSDSVPKNRNPRINPLPNRTRGGVRGPHHHQRSIPSSNQANLSHNWAQFNQELYEILF